MIHTEAKNVILFKYKILKATIVKVNWVISEANCLKCQSTKSFLSFHQSVAKIKYFQFIGSR